MTASNALVAPGFLNAFEILNGSELTWEANLIRFVPKHGARVINQSQLRDLGFKARKQQALTKGSGLAFIIPYGETDILVPRACTPVASVEMDDYRLELVKELRISAADPTWDHATRAILRDAFKQVLRSMRDADNRPLWRYFHDFCEFPTRSSLASYNCRRYSVDVKRIRGNRLVMQLVVGTVTLDPNPIEAYYREGRVHELARMIAAKQENRTDRKGQIARLYALWNSSDANKFQAELIEIAHPDALTNDASLTPAEQTKQNITTIECVSMQQTLLVPPHQLHLIVDSSITLQEHAETILSPDLRWRITERFRQSFSNVQAFGFNLQIAVNPIGINDIAFGVLAPELLVKGEGRNNVIPAAAALSTAALSDRVRKRKSAIKEHGFFQGPVAFNPLVACPDSFSDEEITFVQDAANECCSEFGCNFRFDEARRYTNASELAGLIQDGKFTGALIVVPESRMDQGLYHSIKQLIPIPSQCITIDHAILAGQSNRSYASVLAANDRISRGLRQCYSVCLENLLVKAGFIPFVPKEPFSFNVHIGIDVGGKDNNTPMLFLGHGFNKPAKLLKFRPIEVKTDRNSTEPIRPEDLARAVINLFEQTRKGLIEQAREVDFSSVIFWRDGASLGDGELWQERDGLKQALDELTSNKLVPENSRWVLVEVMKSAEGWRVFQGTTPISNPIVGTCILHSDREDEALVCSTGEPFLMQGTASPLRIRFASISGESSIEEICKELIWEADMCLNKPDMAAKLPWTLRVADVAALNLSHHHAVAGISI
jgi:hypothetical protein